MRFHTASRRNIVSILLILASLFSCYAASAQGSATLTGRVQDSKTGEALAGANIVLVSTSMGGVADIDGKYTLRAIPVGKWTVRASMIGYSTSTHEITTTADSTVVLNFRLEVQTIQGNEVVVTAQALGQQTAIAQQLGSKNIVNVVSSARIQELPDANAAESVGRLPGVSLVRSGGEATQVVIRGLAPQYNSITIDGISIPANDAGSITTGGIYATPTNTPGGRAVDLSMISSNALEGIEVYKTSTPDMDAAVLGGTVNFGLREAKGSASGAPLVTLLAQGAYEDLMNSYHDYKFVASVEQRFFDNRFGVFAQGIAQRQNLTSNQLGGSYYIFNKNKPDDIALGSLNLSFSPTDQRRYDGALTLDYQTVGGKIALVNLVSYGKSTNESHDETYNLANYGNDIQFGTQLSTNQLNVVTNILEYEQTFGAYRLQAKLSNAYSDNRTPSGWRMVFEQASAGTTNIPNHLNPIQIAQAAQDSVNLAGMKWQGNSTWSSFNKQDDMQGSIDLETSFQLSDLVTATVKGGGQYKYTTRYYNFDDGFGSLIGNNASGFRLRLLQALPWLTQAPYSFDPSGNIAFPIRGLYDPTMNFGKFLKGDYAMLSAVNADVLDQIMNEMKILGATTTTPVGPVPSYVPDQYGSVASDYTGNEFRSAEYLMGTFTIGPEVSIMAGFRYQGLKTTYTAAHFDGNADATNPYPQPLLSTNVTQDEYHGYFLPDMSIKYDPLGWLTLRASYTSTLAYPDFSQIIPRMDASSNTGHFVVWNNYALKPARSQNYDFQVSVHDNTIGLFAVSPFLKRIYDQLFSQQSFIANPAAYPGVPAYTKTFSLTTFINNPNRVDVYGIEAEWQTHFWYLPDPFSGLVLNINYTHIFSSAEYPYNLAVQATTYPFLTSHVDTSYTDRLIQQPNDIVNFSLGFDYGKFSVLASMIYQSQVYNGTNFFNSLRSDKDKYLRWDISVKQGLPWDGFEVYADVNNINSEADVYLIRGSGFPTSESNYGLTADLGVRWRPE